MTASRTPYLHVHDEVATALAEGRAVVALETTIVVHGLPAPINLEVAAQCEAVIRDAGAVPATIAVIKSQSGETRIKATATAQPIKVPVTRSQRRLRVTL